MEKLSAEILNFELLDDQGGTVKLADFMGKYLVLYFYPKDDTPGCTVEACSFRDANDDIQALGAVVIGVSKDPLKSHQKFVEHYKLNFKLVSDPEATLQKALGVWQLKKFMGREYMGTARTTFIIGPDGEILKTFEKVKPEGHAQAVLEALKSLLK